MGTEQQSLYARYAKERMGFETIETPEGFLTYRLNGDGSCYIADLYVVPEAHKRGAASRLADQVVESLKGTGCTKLIGTVDVRTNGHEASLRVLLAYGFDVAEAHEGYLVLHKAIP